MPRKTYDPLAAIPPPEAIRERLAQAETLAARLRILLDLAERLHLPLVVAADLTTDERSKGVARG